MSLRGDHNVSLVQHEHRNLLYIEHFVFSAPVEDLAGRADDDVVLDFRAAGNLLSANGETQFNRTELGHFGGHFPSLNGQLVSGRQAQHLRVVQVRVNAAQHCQNKRRRFAGSRLALGDHVLRRIGKQSRQSGFLDFRRFVESHRVDSFQQLRLPIETDTHTR